MPLNTKAVRQYLKGFDFKSLFIEELGWNKIAPSPITVEADGDEYTLTPISEMGGMVVFRCSPAKDGRIPDYATRRKIDKGVTKLYYEHIIIYCDADETTQVWQWVKREKGQPAVSREHRYFKSQTGEALIQKLNGLVFCLGDLDDEGNVPITRVLEPVRAAFDVDRVTKKFYERFSKELTQFQGFIQGITDKANTEWYASLMLNRLMFIYFIQKKGFLDNDHHYLRNRLTMIQQMKGKDKFLSFYRHFLLRLFHEGLGSRARNAELDELLGKIPYLNGGLFEVHDLEKDYPDIQIEDKAFEAIFDFFDQYQWHLDERPLRDDREINPDVLGYIFEKYINQKQMGAYYTKEDITEYISKNTVLPFLFDASRKKCAIAFEGENSVWRLLQDDPDRYIYDAVKAGVDLPLPDEIATGLDDVSRRTEWNKSAPSEYALPTEIWREVVARRDRYEEVRGKLQSGEVKSIDDLITYNLDIRQFAQDVIANAEGSELIKAIWHTIAGRVPEKSNEAHQSPMTVLDPTCGSGAFLFAALNILEPLYEACLDRMEVFVQEADLSGDKTRHLEFRHILERMNNRAKHPNRRYFILKSIILGNIFGVDIMEEAVEICKLRLFLKLVAQVEFDSHKSNYGLEPLPDIDFNIRPGNTLVGFTTKGSVREAFALDPSGQAKIVSEDDEKALLVIEDEARLIDNLWQIFHQNQTLDRGEITLTDKENLRKRLTSLKEKLNRHLARLYGVDADRDTARYDQWQKSHEPLHWFAEFYGIMRSGGFDIIIGNPPYVVYSNVRKTYTVESFVTEPCANLYAFVVERSTQLSRTKRLGLIIPSAGFGTPATNEMRRLLRNCSGALYVSYYSGDAHPSVLFEGVKLRLSIFLTSPNKKDACDNTVFTSGYQRWYAEEREFLFPKLMYTEVPERLIRGTFPKIGFKLDLDILDKLSQNKTTLARVIRRWQTPHCLYYHNAPVFFIRAMNFVPYYESATSTAPSSNHFKTLCTESRCLADLVIGLLNSSVFFIWFSNYSANRDLTLTDIEGFSLPDGYAGINEQELSRLIDGLMEDLERNSAIREYNYTTGTVKYQEFYMRKSKPFLDRIDAALSTCYGLSEVELDHVLNYDIKYRMGLAGGGDEED